MKITKTFLFSLLTLVVTLTWVTTGYATTCVVNSDNGLNVRDVNTKKLVDVLHFGEVIVIDKTDGLWTKVRTTDGKEGYIRTWWLIPEESTTP